LVDPSSPFTNGAVLGDRIRMQDFHKDDNVFIRSIASRGSKGGLSENIECIANVLNHCKFDIIIFETVGIGQIELDVIELVDTVAVILVPESGDDIQMMKAGLIEIADIYVINKYDRKDSNKLFIALNNMLKLVVNDKWTPKIIKTVAINDRGIRELYNAIYNHLNIISRFRN
jgi:LAO/AO transport system kinase